MGRRGSRARIEKMNYEALLTGLGVSWGDGVRGVGRRRRLGGLEGDDAVFEAHNDSVVMLRQL